MTRLLMAITMAAVVLNGCGGGGGSTSAVGFSGKVIDGPISGATVCLDLDSNGACDNGEPSAVTDATGNYKLPIYTGSIEGLHILAVVPADAIDLDTNTAVITPYVLSAPASNPSAVTPLTTLVSAQMLANPSLTPSKAEQITLVTNKLKVQTSSILDVDVTLNSNLHKIAQAVATAIAKTAETLSQDATFSNAASRTNFGTVSSQAVTQATRVTQGNLLYQMQNADGSINSSFLSSGGINKSAIGTLVNAALSADSNSLLSSLTSSVKSGKSSKINMQKVVAEGIIAFKIADGGQYVDGSGAVQTDGSKHYKVERMTSVTGKNGIYRDVGGTWRPNAVRYYDLISGAWIAEYNNVGVANSSSISFNENCFTSPQTASGINMTVCGTSVDISGKKLRDFNFDCIGPSGPPVISGCSIDAVFPTGSTGYNLTVIYDEDQYQLEVDPQITPSSSMSAFISSNSVGGNPGCRGGIGGGVRFSIQDYDASAKTGHMNWYTGNTCSGPPADSNLPFVVKAFGSIEVLLADYPNSYFKASGSNDQTMLFGFAPANTNGASQAGIYQGNFYSAKRATNIFFGASEMQLMNPTAYNFVAQQYSIRALP